MKRAIARQTSRKVWLDEGGFAPQASRKVWLDEGEVLDDSLAGRSMYEAGSEGGFAWRASSVSD